MNAIEIKNLRKIYANGTEALKGIDLTVKQGDFFALLGANGAGKTTIIGILTDLVNLSGGEARIFGHNVVTNSSDAKQLTGIVPQELNFNQFEKVEDIVVNQGGYYGIPREESKKRAEKSLKQLGLWEKRAVISRSLSGGMKRRLMIARALVNNPQLLILDEPTAGVDVELRHSMWDFLDQLNKNGTTILLTTHYLEEVEQMCRHAAIIKEGEIIKNDSVSKLKALVETESFLVNVDQVKELDKIVKYEPKEIDAHTFEVELNNKEDINIFLQKVSDSGMKIHDFRPKGNRIEKLFLKILKE